MADKSITGNSRRYHHKTRRGCLACKQRRIKCDEKKPFCTNCRKKSIECSFVRLVPASVLKTLELHQARQSPVLTLPQLADPRVGHFCRPHSSDFDLFNRYISHTSQVISRRGNGTEIYASVIPKLALVNPALGHAVLAIAYGHLARSMPQMGMGARYLTESAVHMNTTLASYSQAINCLSKETTPAVFAKSLLITLYVFFSSGVEYEELLFGLSFINRDSKSLDQLLCIAVRMIHGIRGVFSVFWKTQQWIATSFLSPIIQRYNPVRNTRPHLFWAQVEDQQLASLRNLWESDASVPNHRACVLSESLQALRDTFSLTTRLYVVPDHIVERYSVVDMVDLKSLHQLLGAAQLDDLPSAFTWYVRTPAPFLGMLQQGDPYAVVIWAHHAILLDRACGRHWWFCDLAAKSVAAAFLVLGEERRAWIEWPLSVVGSGERPCM